MKCPGFGLVDLLKDKEEVVGIEIGCDEAVTTDYLLEKLPNLKLYTIDPYSEYYDWNGTRVEERTHIFEQAKNRLAKYGERVIMVKQPSSEVFHMFEDGSLDFVFVDGIHTYEGVITDCRNYYSKVKEGGIFSGHDYTMIPDVNRAVTEFSLEVAKPVRTTEVDVWYWYK